MYVLFVVFVSHEHAEFHSRKFVDETQQQAAMAAKQWLYEEARHFLRDEIPDIKTEEELKTLFRNSPLDELTYFMQENSEYVHVQFEGHSY